jgi:antitoxin MazE
MTTRTRIIPIGNSQGVRIPKPLLEQSGLSDEVELDVQEGRIVIQRVAEPRAGWEAAYRKAAESGADEPLDPPTPTEWDEEEWTW